MIKLPKIKNKYKKYQKHKIKDFKSKFDKPTYKCVRFISNERCYLSLVQILYIRTLFRKMFKRRIKMIIPLVVNYQDSKKSSHSRMGRGTGNPYKWYISVTQGTVLFEFIILKKSINPIRLKYLLVQKVIKRLPIKNILIKKYNYFKLKYKCNV